jgi:activator of HSP90 ATPase
MAAAHQIRHTVRFNVSARAVYRALMDSWQHEAFTGAPAKIDPTVGGRFTAWGANLSGINVELVRDRRIVQAWRALDWPQGHYSIATFELKRAGKGTLLVFTQAGVPSKNLKDINAGWKTHYWQLLKKYFEKG